MNRSQLIRYTVKASSKWKGENNGRHTQSGNQYWRAPHVYIKGDTRLTVTRPKQWIVKACRCVIQMEAWQ